MVFWETESFTFWSNKHTRAAVRHGPGTRRSTVQWETQNLIVSTYQTAVTVRLVTGKKEQCEQFWFHTRSVCRNTCLCQLHIKRSQSQGGAPGLLWEEEGGHKAIIVSGPVEEEEEEEEVEVRITRRERK